MSDVLDRPIISDLTQAAADYASASRSSSTSSKYESNWREFCRWCATQEQSPFSGEATIALQIADMARRGLSMSTISVRLAAIRHHYIAAGVPLNMDDSELAAVRAGIARTIGTAPSRKAAPVRADDLRLMIAARQRGSAPLAARDRLALLLGFGGALRRSEIVALNIGDVVEERGRGVRVTVRRSKTDQTGAGKDVYIASNPTDVCLCVSVALRRWMDYRSAAHDLRGLSPAEIANRPLLCAVNRGGNLSGEALTDKAIVDLIKDAADLAGLDGSAFSGHSLRRGLLTDGAERGADLKALARHARHSKLETTMGYVDEANRWIGNPSSVVFGGGA